MKSLLQTAAPLVAALVLAFGIAASAQGRHPAPAPPSGQTAPSGTAAAKAPGKPGQNAPPVGQLRREVRLVNMVFSVLNSKDHFVTDLKQNNFEVFDNNIPQHVEFFNRETNLPLRIGLLMDTSNSIRPRLRFEKSTAFDFLYHIIRPGKDMAFVMTFDTQPQIQQGFTDNLDLLRHAIDEQQAGGGTALYDAIYAAARDYLMNSPPAAGNQNMRRVLVVISDGMDDLSGDTRSEAVDMAERAGVVIYTISSSRDWLSPDQQTAEGLPLKLHYNAGDRILQAFSDQTGGRAFFPSQVDDLAKAFADISTELRTQYSIAFTPSNEPNDGKFHHVQIEIVGRNGLKVRSRQGYWAPSLSGAPIAAGRN
ncbi:MAG TPA: VWA domain-containing protein [Candidatus Dormibacteraeota bacterium]|nr:VWA domain-containing protein [Candidatus Dormibacteraeota bacterium]